MNYKKAVAISLSIFTVAITSAWAYRGVHRRALVTAAYAPAPDGMVFVPPGEFLVGSKDPDAPPDEGPLRTKFLPGFYIDQFEVTHAAYKLFEPSHEIPTGKERHPMTGLSLEEAKAYATAVGKRIPTAIEWEKAARGTDGRVYPWGDTFFHGYANLGEDEKLVAVGSYPKGVSPYGAHDMTGNAWEWVETPYVQKGLLGEPIYTTEIIKGGAFSYAPFQGRAAYNGFEGNGGTCNDVGFRCVKAAVSLQDTPP